MYTVPPKTKGRMSDVEENHDYFLEEDGAAGGEPVQGGAHENVSISSILQTISNKDAGEGQSSTPKRKSTNAADLERERPSPEGPTERFQAIGTETQAGKKWTEAQEMQLCQLWREETHLYDSTSANYRRTDRRQDSIKRIATILNMEGECPLIAH